MLLWLLDNPICALFACLLPHYKLFQPWPLLIAHCLYAWLSAFALFVCYKDTTAVLLQYSCAPSIPALQSQSSTRAWNIFDHVQQHTLPGNEHHWIHLHVQCFSCQCVVGWGVFMGVPTCDA